MFEQFTKSFQLPTNDALVASLQESNVAAQKHFASWFASATEFAQLEIQNAVSLSKATKPEQVWSEVSRAAQVRQSFFIEKSKAGFEHLVAATAEAAKSVQFKNEEVVAQAHGAVDAAFANAKQGLNIAETTTKSVLSKSSAKKKA